MGGPECVPEAERSEHGRSGPERTGESERTDGAERTGEAVRAGRDDRGGQGEALDLDGLRQFVREHGLFSWLGLELEALDHERAVLAVPYDEKITNYVEGSEDNVHGGIAATLIDTASGFALRTTFEQPERAALTTTDLHVSYLRPATGDLRVEAEVVRAGGSMGVTEASVTSTAPDGEKREVATGSTSYRLFRGER
jgi:uncharacterized protein (TIGR00369 family)